MCSIGWLRQQSIRAPIEHAQPPRALTAHVSPCVVVLRSLPFWSSFRFVQDPSFEIAGAVNDTNDLLEKLDTWNALVEVPKPLHLQDDDEVLMVTEPLGVVLVIAAWNFPLVTSMPLASALAGGG